MRIFKVNTHRLILFYFILCQSVVCGAVEMWVDQIDKTIPSLTPAGHLNNTAAFILRMVNPDAGDASINLYNSILMKVRTSTGKELEGKYVRNATIRPTLRDIIILDKGDVFQQCYTIHLTDDSLWMRDESGGVTTFEGVGKGEIKIEISFFSDFELNKRLLQDIERDYADGGRLFIRGPIACGTLMINVADIPTAKTVNPKN